MDKFDSVGELHFSYWTDELIKEGYIEQVVLQPEAYILSNPVNRMYEKKMKKAESKKMSQTILREHVYTPDVLIVWTKKAKGIFYVTIEDADKLLPHHLIANHQGFENRDVWATTIELKPSYDHQNMTRLASLNIKWVYEKYNHVIEMVKMPDFFKKTFTPDRYLLTDKSYESRKINFKTRSLRSFINDFSEQKKN